MNRRRLFVTGALTLALAFGIWTMAISFTPISSSFNAGDEVSSSTFNQLFSDIDANFTAAATEFDNKVSTAGDSMTGILEIEGDTGSPDFFNSGTSNAALQVTNTTADGISAYIEATSSGAALHVKNLGSGPIFRATNSNLGGLKVANDGSITINPDGGTDTISLDSVSGDITISGSVRNKSGRALTPIAHGVVDSSGNLQTGSGNIAVSRVATGVYEVEISGEAYSYRDYVSIATAVSGTAEVGSNSGNLFIETFDHSGNASDAFFNFVTYKP